MTCCSSKIIDKIKVVGKIENVAARNGVNYTDGFLEFGGPLIHDTIVNGNYNLSFGSYGSNIKYFSVSSNTTVYLEANNGSVGSFINIENNRILIGSSSPGSGGLMGLHDYTAGQNDGRFYAQRIFVDNHIVGKPATNAVTQPGAPQDQQMIAWNNPTGQWIMKNAGGAPSAGASPQVIYNWEGALVGNTNFTFNQNSNTLSAPLIDMGHDQLAGPTRYLTMRSSENHVGLYIYIKGAAQCHVGLFDGAFVIGSPAATSLVQKVRANGANPQVDIALEPKGPDGMVFIGDKDEAGSYKRLAARGYNANVNLMLQSKGTGHVIIDPDPDATGGGWIKLGHGSAYAPGVKTRRLFASSDYVTTNLEIGGDGVGFVLHVGTSDNIVSTRYLTAASYAADCNLNIYGKGQGLAFLNGFAFYKKIAIVNWNMDANASASVPHSIDAKKIVSIVAVIRDDYDATYRPLNTVTGGSADGWVVSWTSGVIVLERRGSPGFFDGPQYALTGGYIRGWVYIAYEL